MLVKTSKNAKMGLEDDKRFMLNQLEHSEKMKAEERSIDKEVLDNYLMHGAESGPRLASGGYKRARMRGSDTHTMVETLNAKLTLSLLGEDGFISASRVGPEDIFGAEAVRLLQESTFRKPGNFRAVATGNKNAIIFGTEVYFPFWKYQEVNAPLRLESINPYTGLSEVTEHDGNRVIANHVELMPLGDDFFPEPGKDEVRNMMFCARRFTIPAFQARQMAKDINPSTGKPRWDKQAVERAIRRVSKDHDSKKESRMLTDASQYSGSSPYRSKRSDSAVPNTYSPHSDYEILVGYEGYGLTPHLNSDKARRRRITIINEEIVESVPMPINSSRICPFYDVHINPMQGRFYGVSPAKIARYTQDFNNALLLCLGEAVVRQARPPVMVQKGAGVDMQRLRDWKGPIRTLDVNAVKEMRYNPQLGEAFAMLSGREQSIREASGALGAITGAGFGQTQIRSASEAVFLGQQALDRPEMMAAMFEYEYLPALGQGILDLHQQFIADTEDLQKRIGKETLNIRYQGRKFDATPQFDSIQGEFDIRFSGSRRSGTKQLRLQAIERALSVVAAIPGAAPLFPFEEVFVEYLSLLDMDKIESLVANPSSIDRYVELAVAQQGAANINGNQNGQGASMAPQGMGPAQLGGSSLA